MIRIPLTNGWAIESGNEPDSDLDCGDWVRIVSPEDEEVLYWYWTEWEEDPPLVMGAFLNAARKYSTGDNKNPDICEIRLANGKTLGTGFDPEGECDCAYGAWVHIMSPEGEGKIWHWSEWEADPRRVMRDILLKCSTED